MNVKEAGDVFVYLSYEDQSNNYVYFDDFKVTHTKSNLIQGNEYYPFGLQTANSWTRESVTGNNYLANGGTEMNQTSKLYDLEFRNYDPALGRMFQIDPLAAKYASLTPYNYVANNPVTRTDPYGDDMVIMNGRLANPHSPHTGAEMWDLFDRYYYAQAWGGGDAGGMSSYGQSLSSIIADAKAQAMANQIKAAYYGASNGSTLLSYTNGWLSDVDFMSTRDLLNATGQIIAREYYGGMAECHKGTNLNPIFPRFIWPPHPTN